jgi:hypothetical protein
VLLGLFSSRVSEIRNFGIFEPSWISGFETVKFGIGVSDELL